MEKHGIMRIYWEGCVQVERIINHMKHLVSRGTHVPGLASSMLTKYYKNNCISEFIEQNDYELDSASISDNMINQDED